MKVIEVHPEELLDRELAGTLSEEQRVRLAAHLAQCAVCRLERQMRADFAMEAASHAALDLNTAVLGAVQKARAEPLTSVVAGQAGGRTRQAVAMALAACMLLGTGVALAQTSLAQRLMGQLWTFVGGKGGAPTATAPNRRAVQAPVAHVNEPATLALQPVPRHEEPTPAAISREPASARVDGEPAPISSARARAATAARQRGHAKASSQRAAAPTARDASFTSTRADGNAAQPARHGSPEPSTVRPAMATPAGAPASAGGLFEQANSLRRARQGGEAARSYRELQLQFPGSAEAKLSHALLARMLLDAGDARGAESSFALYLSSGQPALREEAMAGRALALERLGDREESLRAYQALLSAYPRSSYAALAKRKLGLD